MQIDQTGLDGVLILTPRRHGDARGFFAETYNRDAIAAAGLDLPPLREEASWLLSLANASESLTFQAPPRPRGQLLRCARGAVRVSVVEGRGEAPAYGSAIEVTLSAADGRQLWVPAGRLVAWQAVEEDSEIVSNATDFLVPDLTGTAPRDLAGWSSPFGEGPAT